MATKFKVVEPEVYSVATTNVIRRCIPFRYREMLNESLGDLNIPEKEKLQKIKEFLAKKKIAAQQECQLVDGESRVERPVKPIGGRSSNVGGRDREATQPAGGQNTRQHNQGHNCYEDDVCEVKWHGLGCRDLYKIHKVEDRSQFLKSRGRCMRCGNFYKSRPQPGMEPARNRYEWKGYKEKAKCTDNNCL